MKKGVLLSLLAIVFVGVIIFGIWYINESERMRSGSKDSFIPYNSALVIHLNQNARLAEPLKGAFAGDIQKFQERLLCRVADTLMNKGYVNPAARILAMRLEGKNDVTLLYVMDSRDVLSRGEMADFLKQAFSGHEGNIRKYDNYKIHTLKKGEEEIYFSICGGIVLISDSDLYIEDGLKQFDQEGAAAPQKPYYQNLNKYFSTGAGINILLNTATFTDLLPLVMDVGKMNPRLDITKFFKWGAFDGELNEQGVCLNGFMHYAGLPDSYLQTLEKQQPREIRIDGVVPVKAISFGMLNLSNVESYFQALDAYRYNIGLKDKMVERKQQLARMFGQGVEEELRKLLLGEFAVVNMAYNGAKSESDGVIIAQLKSGSLCQALLEKMMNAYARFEGKSMDDYRRAYHIDREKSFDYYAFPVDDLAAVYWGYLFGGIQNRFVLVEDNYLVFASSESAMKDFIGDYVHSSFVRDAEWYQKLRTRLSGKYNLSWFAEVGKMLPFYQDVATGDWKQYIMANTERLSVFSTLAAQWSNEGNMLYSTIFLNTDKIQNDVRPHLLWRTKLDARVSMKPAPVVNHVTGERELLVQDDENAVYLINDAGRILWKQAVDGRINSDIYQVDVFKNGKLQYLFSTPSKMYLLDRNGNPVGRYPVTFRAKCERGITVYDYDNKRDYRIFAPGEDRELYLYGLDGVLVQGWDCRKADKQIVTKVQHFRVNDKDYIVFADRYRLYILDRKGKERVNTASVLELRENTDLYLAGKDDEAVLVFANASGGVNVVDFKGRMQTVDCGKMSAAYNMNVADVNGDGVMDLVFTDAEKLSVYDLSGKLISEKSLDAHSLDYPYVYRFSASDSRIGLIDREQNRMLLLSPDGAVSKGFPITGDSPFSIIFSGTDGFFLFAGADNGTLIKYKVQR